MYIAIFKADKWWYILYIWLWIIYFLKLLVPELTVVHTWLQIRCEMSAQNRQSQVFNLHNTYIMQHRSVSSNAQDELYDLINYASVTKQLEHQTPNVKLIWKLELLWHCNLSCCNTACIKWVGQYTASLVLHGELISNLQPLLVWLLSASWPLTWVTLMCPPQLPTTER